jgi:hypothetical protein
LILLLSLPLLSIPITSGGTLQQAAESVEQKGQDMEKKAQQNQGKEQMNDPMSSNKL